MLKLLVPIDGSQHSDRAVDYAIQRARRTRDGASVELLNVQLPMTGVNVKMFISQESLESYYRDEAMTVLQPALHRLRARLEQMQRISSFTIYQRRARRAYNSMPVQMTVAALVFLNFLATAAQVRGLPPFSPHS